MKGFALGVAVTLLLICALGPGPQADKHDAKCVRISTIMGKDGLATVYLAYEDGSVESVRAYKSRPAGSNQPFEDKVEAKWLRQ
jgi:hypothetical protein